MTMEERRRFVRLNARLPLTYLVLPSGSAQQTVTKNLGGGGICFFAEKVMRPGTRLQVAMTLPDREQAVHCIAEVVSSVQYEVTGRSELQRAVEVGIRFLEIAPRDQDAVIQYVTRSLQLHPPRA